MEIVTNNAGLALSSVQMSLNQVKKNADLRPLTDMLPEAKIFVNSELIQGNGIKTMTADIVEFKIGN